MREGLWTSIAGRLGPRWFRTEGPGRVALLKISGSAPLAAEGPLDLAIKGNLDAGLANRSMSAAGRRLTGSVAVDGRLGARRRSRRPTARSRSRMARSRTQSLAFALTPFRPSHRARRQSNDRKRFRHNARWRPPLRGLLLHRRVHQWSRSRHSRGIAAFITLK